MVFFLKLLLLFRRVSGNAEDDRTCLLDLAVCVAEPARFFGSAGGVGFRIEKKHYRLAAKIFQGNLFAVLIRRTKVRGLIIDFHGMFS
jgi:hypothetical protein